LAAGIFRLGIYGILFTLQDMCDDVLIDVKASRR